MASINPVCPGPADSDGQRESSDAQYSKENCLFIYLLVCLLFFFVCGWGGTVWAEQIYKKKIPLLPSACV